MVQRMRLGRVNNVQEPGYDASQQVNRQNKPIIIDDYEMAPHPAEQFGAALNQTSDDDNMVSARLRYE
jgi:hypothetical protein